MNRNLYGLVIISPTLFIGCRGFVNYKLVIACFGKCYAFERLGFCSACSDVLRRGYLNTIKGSLIIASSFKYTRSILTFCKVQTEREPFSCGSTRNFLGHKDLIGCCYFIWRISIGKGQASFSSRYISLQLSVLVTHIKGSLDNVRAVGHAINLIGLISRHDFFYLYHIFANFGKCDVTKLHFAISIVCYCCGLRKSNTIFRISDYYAHFEGEFTFLKRSISVTGKNLGDLTRRVCSGKRFIAVFKFYSCCFRIVRCTSFFLLNLRLTCRQVALLVVCNGYRYAVF